MRKILLIMFLLTMTISAKTFTKAEKQEMLKQFVEFQNIIKNKDEDGFIYMLETPDLPGFFNIMGEFTADDKKEMQRNSNGIVITEKMLRRHSAQIFQDMEETISYIQVDLNTGKVKNYFVDSATAEDKKRKYFFDKSRDCYFYYNNLKEKVYLEDLRIWDKCIELGFTEEGLYVIDYWVENRLTPKKSLMESGFVYEFSFKNNRLKLHDMYVND